MVVLTDFEQYLLWEDLVLLNRLILDHCPLGRWGGPEKTSLPLSLLEVVVVLKGPILDDCYFGCVQS